MDKRTYKKHIKIIIMIILILLIIDQITKFVANKNGWIYTEKENIETNHGYYIVMGIIVVLLIIKYITNDNSFIKLDTKIVLSFGMTGAIGNTIDRIFQSKVINFIKLTDGFYLNLSYIYILIAWIGMAIILTKNSFKIFKERKQRKRDIE